MPIEIQFDAKAFIYTISFQGGYDVKSSYAAAQKKFEENGVTLPTVDKVSGDTRDHCGPEQVTGAINCLKAALITLEQNYFIHGANIVSSDKEFCQWSDHFLVALEAVEEKNLIKDQELKAIKNRFYAVQNKKYSSLLNTHTELEAIAKNLNLPFKEFPPQIKESSTPKECAEQVASLLEENNQLYKAIVEAARAKATEYNDLAVKAISLSLSANCLKTTDPVLWSGTQPPSPRILPEPGTIYPFLTPDKDFPHLNEGNYQHSGRGRASVFEANRITIKEDDIQRLKTMLEILSNFIASENNNNPIEKDADLVQSVKNIVNGEDVTQKAKLLHEFNSKNSPLISVIYDKTLIKTEEERLDLLTKLAQEKPYRFAHQEVEKRKNIAIPGNSPESSEFEPIASPLHHAVHHGSPDVVKILLLQGADCNVQETCISSFTTKQVSHEGITPLHIAVGMGDLEKVKLLLAYKANINAVNDKGQAPLHLVTNKAVFDFLVENGANINQKDVNGQSPLHFAAKNGNTEIVEALLEKKEININIQDTLGNTPLHLAAAKKFQENNWTLSPAINQKQENLAIMSKLLEKGASINQVNHHGYSALHFAVMDNDRGVLQEYDSYGSKLDYGHILKQVDLLCQNKADVNCQSYDVRVKKSFFDTDDKKNHPAPLTTPLLALYASKKQHDKKRLEIAKILIQNGAKADIRYTSFGNYPSSDYQPGQTLLDRVALSDTDGIKYFVSQGLNPNDQYTPKSPTPPHIFMDLESPFNTKKDNNEDALLKAGADPSKIANYQIELNPNNIETALRLLPIILDLPPKAQMPT